MTDEKITVVPFCRGDEALADAAEKVLNWAADHPSDFGSIDWVDPGYPPEDI